MFKYLRRSNDSALFDCDVFGPTFRSNKLLSDEEEQHAYITPNYSKLDEDIPLSIFEGLIDFNFLAVREKGIIVMDGLGHHTEKTEALINRAECLIIICKGDLNREEMYKSKYVKDGEPLHPFEFYNSRKNKIMKIITHLTPGASKIDSLRVTGELHGLDREGIHKGEIVNIQADTCSEIKKISELITKCWF